VLVGGGGGGGNFALIPLGLWRHILQIIDLGLVSQLSGVEKKIKKNISEDTVQYFNYVYQMFSEYLNLMLVS